VKLPPSRIIRECKPGHLVVELENEPGVQWSARRKSNGRHTIVLLVRGGSC